MNDNKDSRHHDGSDSDFDQETSLESNVEKGDWVEIFRLASRRGGQFNGSTGEVMSAKSGAERVVVRVDMSPKAVLRANFMVVGSNY